MSKWLIKYYPVKPAQSLMAYNLDVLDVEDYCSKQYQMDVREELEEYEFGVHRRGLNENGIAYYNNKTMSVIEANNIKEAFDIFVRKLGES